MSNWLRPCRPSEQFESAGLCAFNNNWHQVYDFNAFDDGDESHWTLIPALTEAEERNLLPDLLPKHLEVSVEGEASIVPVTAGVRSPRDFACLVVLFSDGYEKSRARTLINTLTPHPVSPKVASSSHLDTSDLCFLFLSCY